MCLAATSIHPCFDLDDIYLYLFKYFNQKKTILRYIEQSLQPHQPIFCHNFLSNKEIEGYLIHNAIV